MACAVQAVMAHTDLQLQIAAITRQIEASPDAADLYLKRGDLHRRHQDWDAAAADFASVRRLASGLSETDWFEGRMRVDAGQFEAGERLLSRFLEANPGHTGALQARARSHWGQRAPGAAAHDYQQAIDRSESPAPALYRALVVTQVAMG
ncbi:MAG: tetratricopeptide repeat protein, partial [Xanthomonadales bacterium]|nr:tetratricopeptide repeat protein [Xanthomonadales bacterium]